MIESASGAPADYEELYVHYYRLIVSVMRKAGIPQAELEDAAAWMMVVLMEKDIIGMYDPEKVHVVSNPRKSAETHRTARFSGLLKRVVYLYSLQYRDKVISAARQRPVDPLSEGSVLFGGVDEGFEDRCGDRLAAAQQVAALRVLVGERAPHLFPVLEVLAADPGVTQREVASRLGMSAGTVGAHIRALRGLALECGVVVAG